MASTRAADVAAHRAYVVGEVRHLTAGGVWPGWIARDLGYANADTLARTLYRWGHDDLAQRMHVEEVTAA